jgi:hypothetical protein
MGLFDIFRRKPAGSDQVAATGTSVAYLFAHKALPSVFFSNPAKFVVSLQSEEGLASLWQQAQKCLSQHSAIPKLAPHPFRLCGRYGFVIELPTPQSTGEAYMVALLVRLPGSIENLNDHQSYLRQVFAYAMAASGSESVSARFFTLEMANSKLLNSLGVPYESRLIAALRKDPTLLIRLLAETQFRISFFGDLVDKLGSVVSENADLRERLAPFFSPSKIIEALTNSPAAFSALLDEYERRLTPTYTVLGSWGPDGKHANHGDGSRVNPPAFLSDIAVLLETSDSPPSRV